MGLEDSMSQVSKALTLLSDIMKQFDKELPDERADFEKHLHEEREKLLVQYHSPKQDISTCKYKPYTKHTFISQQAPNQQHINQNKDSGFQSNVQCRNDSFYIDPLNYRGILQNIT